MTAIIAKNRNPATQEQERMQIRFHMRRAFLSSGKLCTDPGFDSDLEAAVEAEWTKRESRRAANEARQLELIDTGRNAADSQLESLKLVGNKASIKRAVLELLGTAGRHGQTRYQLAQAKGCQQSSLCSTVLELINSGDVVELREMRTSDVGGRGCVLVLSDHAEGRQHA